MFYQNILNDIGFASSAFNFKQYSANTSFTVEQVALDTVKAVASQAGMAAAKSSFDALSKLPDSLKFFDKHSSNMTSNGTFQLLVCDQTQSGDVSIGIGVFYFHSKKYDPRYLWTEWSKDDRTLFVGKQGVVLNEGVYARVRDAIAEYLGDRMHTLISPIPL